MLKKFKSNIYQYLSYTLLTSSLFFMTGCTIPFLGSSQPQNITLTYDSLWEPKGTYQDIVLRYQTSNPNVTININDNSASTLENYKQDLLSRLQSGQNVPDILRIHISWLPEFKPYLEGEVFPANEFNTNYYPGVPATVAEKIVNQDNYLVYGLPLYYDALMLVYNRAHFEEAGIRAAPSNWEQFFRSVSFLTKKDTSGQVVRSAGAFGTTELEFYTDIFGLLLSNANLLFPSDVEEDSDVLRSVVRVLNRSTDWNPGFGVAGSAFAARRTSMVILPAWRVNDILTSNKDIELAVAPVPSTDVESPRIWPTYFVEVVPKNSQNPREAWKFLRHLGSEESLRDIYSKQASTRRLPSLPALVSLADSIQIDPMLKELSNYAKVANSPHLNGSSIVFSDRAGNGPCVDAVKGFYSTEFTSSRTEEFTEQVNLVKIACKLTVQ